MARKSPEHPFPPSCSRKPRGHSSGGRPTDGSAALSFRRPQAAIDMGDTVLFALVSDAPRSHPLLVRNFLGRERLDRLRRLARKDRDRFRKEVAAVDRYVEEACHLVVRKCLDLGVAEVAVGGRSVKNPYTVKPRSLWENPLLNLSLQLLQTLRFQCILGGIDLQVVDEAFTSRVDSLCLQPLAGEGNLKPGRMGHCNRRQFLSSCGEVIHRDLNGAINIGRRAFGDEFARPILEDQRWQDPELAVVFPEGPSDPEPLWRFSLAEPWEPRTEPFRESPERPWLRPQGRLVN